MGGTGALLSRYLRCQGLEKRDPRIGMEQGLPLPLLRIRNLNDGDAVTTTEFRLKACKIVTRILVKSLTLSSLPTIFSS